MSMPGIDPDSGSPDLLTPWSERRMPFTSPFSRSGSETGIPGQIWTAPVDISYRADPLVELSDGEDEAVLVEE